MRSSINRWAALLSLGAVLLAQPAFAASDSGTQVGIGLRAGTLGLGADIEFRINDAWNARIGYSGYSLDRAVTQTDVHYDGKLKLSNPTALLDWRVLKGGFHFTVGVVAASTKIDAVGRPTGTGTYTVNNHVYTTSDIGSLTGSFKFGNSFAPYFGAGFGNVVGRDGHFAVLFDIGAIYAGAPTIALNGVCAPGIVGTPACTQLQADVAAEKVRLASDLTVLKWYPVIGLGVGFRF
jgi:hypothetical protein